MTDLSSGHHKDEFKHKLDAAVRHFADKCKLETIQVYATSVMQNLQHKFYVVYDQSVEWIDELQWRGKLEELWDTTVTKSHDLFDSLRYQGLFIRISGYIGNIRTFMHSQVSKQALFFGCAGLVTGGFIGLCIGYTAKNNGWSSQFCYSGSSSLMRTIITTNSRRGIDGITLTSIPIPNYLRPDEILVQVKAVGLDNIDAKIANGYGHAFRRQNGINSVHIRQNVKEPFALGRECSGVVVDIGHQVISFEINDRVWVCVPFWSSKGLISEYIVVSEKFAGLKPKNIGYEGAATLPYASTVVWRELVNKSHLGPHTAKNKRVLIHLGVTSKNDGVGLLATQVLKTWGARVTISTEESSSDEDNHSGVAQMTFLHSLKSLGAESHLIIPKDHSQIPNLTQRIFDVVVNTDARHLTPILENFCKDPHGSVVETFPKDFERKTFRIWDFFSKALSVQIFSPKDDLIESSQLSLNECKKLVETGLVVPVVAKSFLVSQYDQAFRHVANSMNSPSAHAHIGKSVMVFKAS